MKHPFLQQIIVFSIPILILIGLIIPPTVTSMTGEEVRLQTKPIDPTDLFRGSYVYLSYDIEEVKPSQLHEALAKEIKKKYEGDVMTVYVSLTKGKDNVYTIKTVTEEKPNQGIYLKGKLSIPYEYEEDMNTSESTYYIDYNLSEYYAPSKEAKQIEKTTSMKPAVAILKVKDGRAVITDIVIP